jgi:DNA (cytosine-5)-methyltransferase 1
LPPVGEDPDVLWPDRARRGNPTMIFSFFSSCLTKGVSNLQPLTGGTLFSGIGAPEVAAQKIDWRWCAEIDRFASAVLAERFPHVLNLGDVTKIKPAAIEPVDLVVFGSPCQSFSVAGKRQGLDDPRGNLAFVALRLIGRIRPRWIVFENVPGLLSSGAGRDFGAILGALAKCGYGFAYRILDAQFFGVPQRRRRLFLVGCLGDWRAAAAVLFERQSLRRDPAPRSSAAQRVAPSLESRPAGSGLGTNFLASGGLAVREGAFPSLSGGTGGGAGHQYRQKGNEQALIVPLLEVGTRNSASADKHSDCTDTLVLADPISAHEARTYTHEGKNNFRLHNVVPGVQSAVVAFDTTQLTHPANRSSPKPGDDLKVLQVAALPRRLTPRECERLQGLPDDWTVIPYRGKPAADGPRYRAIGNSMAVPVIGWILDRIRRAKFE